MKILAYSHNCPPSVGGIATYCDTLCAALTEAGEELSLLAPGGAANNFPYPLVAMPACLAHDRIILAGYARSVRCLRVALKELRPDVLWCVSVDALYVAALTPVDVAVAVTVHGSEIVKNFGQPGLVQAIRARLIRRTLARADRIIAVSRYTGSLIDRYLPQVAAKVDVVHNGVGSVQGDTILTPGRDGRSHTLLSVGRFVEFKGFHLFPEVLAGLLRLVPDLRWVLAGDGEYRGKIAGEIARFGLQDRVTLSGMAGPAALGELYRSADLLVHPAVTDGQGRDESFGLVLIEAMLNGCPVATTGAGGTGEIVDDGATGIIFDLRGPDEAAVKLAGYLTNPKRLREIARCGKENARQHFTHNQCAAKTLASLQRAQAHYAASMGLDHG